LIDPKPGRVGEPGGIGQPTLGACQFGYRLIEPVGGHHEQRGLVRRGEIGPFGAGTDRGTDAEFFPQRADGEHDAEFKHALDIDLGDVGCGPGGNCTVAVLEYAVDALHQPFESNAIHLIGAAKAMDHTRLRLLCLGVPDALGEGVVGDGRAVSIPPLRDPQIHAHEIAHINASDKQNIY